ncbi:MAG: ATP-binding protein [Pseudomonadota bacterium]|nr:ATP-binding protein [Pseudomonadota bacterium]
MRYLRLNSLSKSVNRGSFLQLLCFLFTVGIFFAIFDNLNKPAARLVVAGATVIALINFVAYGLRKKEIQQVLKERIKSAYRSRLASLAEMSSGIAHEINNPLTIIEGFAHQIISMAKRDQSDVTKNIYLAEKIVENSERISKIIRALRSFSREGDKEPTTKVALEKIISDTLNFCKTRFKSHGIELSCPEIDPNITLNCRPVQIAQIFLNLLYNAFDAVKIVDHRWIRIDVNEQRDFVLISITDSGPGIPLEVREKIFQPFFTTKDIGNGAGLGLSICISLIKEHNGEIQFDSESINTRFVIKLPKTSGVPAVRAA